MAYVIEHEGKQFSPDGAVQVGDTTLHNRAVEAQELEAWKAAPDRHCAYASGNGVDITTWLGTKIGTVVWGRSYRNNFGAKITAIRVRGTNGAEYHARYGSDWSQLVRLRKVRGS